MRFLYGWPLFVLILALAVTPLINRTLGQIAMAVLAGLYLLTLTSIKQASFVGRSSKGEDAQTNWERGKSV